MYLLVFSTIYLIGVNYPLPYFVLYSFFLSRSSFFWVLKINLLLLEYAVNWSPVQWCKFCKNIKLYICKFYPFVMTRYNSNLRLESVVRFFINLIKRLIGLGRNLGSRTSNDELNILYLWASVQLAFLVACYSVWKENNITFFNTHILLRTVLPLLSPFISHTEVPYC